jgi:hypothetical protein
MDNPNQNRCTCGDISVHYYSDENQHEPNCWDCYYQAQDKRQGHLIHDDSLTDDDLPF